MGLGFLFHICSSANAIMQQEVIMRDTADTEKSSFFSLKGVKILPCRIRYRSPVGPFDLYKKMFVRKLVVYFYSSTDYFGTMVWNVVIIFYQLERTNLIGPSKRCLRTTGQQGFNASRTGWVKFGMAVISTGILQRSCTGPAMQFSRRTTTLGVHA